MTVETQMSDVASHQLSILRPVENMDVSRHRLCLFGKPDLGSADVMLSQQFDVDRKRFIDRWGFDILSHELVKPVKVPKKISKASENKENVDASSQDRKKSPGFCDHTHSKCKKNDKENRCPDCSSPKKTLKMMKEKTYAKKGRQAQMTGEFNAPNLCRLFVPFRS